MAVYLEPWHADVFEFLELRKNHGKEEQRARDLFYGLWVPDLFMERVKADADWTLFCPNESYDENGKGLMDLWGEDFNRLYLSLEAAGKGRKTVKAQHLWSRIVEAQMEAPFDISSHHETQMFRFQTWLFHVVSSHLSDRNALHALQGSCQSEVQPAKPGHHPLLQPLH